jgi:hypothetical protein
MSLVERVFPVTVYILQPPHADGKYSAHIDIAASSAKKAALAAHEMFKTVNYECIKVSLGGTGRYAAWDKEDLNEMKEDV